MGLCLKIDLMKRTISYYHHYCSINLDRKHRDVMCRNKSSKLVSPPSVVHMKKMCTTSCVTCNTESYQYFEIPISLLPGEKATIQGQNVKTLVYFKEDHWWGGGHVRAVRNVTLF
jgi:hypothetical protein